MKEELADECNYIREGSFIRTFGSSSFLGKDPRFKVPWVWEGSTDHVLVMERLDGISVGEAEVSGLSQRDRNDVGHRLNLPQPPVDPFPIQIAARISELCLKELFEFRLMQTDPNWTNFLWNPRTSQVCSSICMFIPP